ncbi:MAG: hypothetical protein CMF80_03095 [Candidatus Marinimicrobia bacterium]|nr:hypothetical protein [Candidatus Neomarinimicrobiota bacterium]
MKAFLIILFTHILLSQNQSINIPSGVKIDISGEVEMEFIDVEGKGGTANREALRQEVYTRSPHTRIDKAVLDFKVYYTENITYRLSFNFNDNKGYADKYYLKYNNGNTQIKIGKDRPAVALKRITEGYPLIGTAYWKGREYQVDWQQTFDMFTLGSTISLKRPLGYDDAAEDKSFRMLVYDDTDVIDGQTIEYGLRASTSLGKLNFMGWYYTGKLIDDADWKGRLHFDFDYYPESNTVQSADANIDHYWLGGRADYTIFNTNFRGEYIKSKDGFLLRNGFYSEVSRNLELPFLDNSIRLLGRYGELNNDEQMIENQDGIIFDSFLPLLKDPHTWDRNMITLAAIYNLTDYAKIKIEYYMIDEDTGDTQEAADSGDRDYQPNIKDNQLLVQFELSF